MALLSKWFIIVPLLLLAGCVLIIGNGNEVNAEQDAGLVVNDDSSHEDIENDKPYN